MRRVGSEAGMSLAALLAGITIMMILMGAATPSWRYVMKDAREEELFFRGDQIASAIERFQKKNGGTLPTSMDVLVKGKFLRKAYTDPMTKHGKWRMVMKGENVNVRVPGMPAPGGRPVGGKESADPPFASPTPRSASPPPMVLGPMVGVASTSTDKSLRLMNGADRYDEWLFIAGQPRVIGKLEVVMKPGAGVGPPGNTGLPPANPPPAR